MSKTVIGSRMIQKLSEDNGVIPTIPSNDDHTTGWLITDIYKSELFVNTNDDRAWTRTNNDIIEFVLADPSTGKIPNRFLTDSVTGTYSSIYDDTLTIPETLGGIVSGTTVGSLTGQTMSYIIDNLLFPSINPSIQTNRSGSLAGVTTQTLEVGTSLSPSTTSTYNPGVIKNGNNTTGSNLTGNANQYVFRLPNDATDGTYVVSSNSQLHTYSSYNIAFGSNIWDVIISYDAGTGVYYDSKMNPSTLLDASRVASSITVNSNTVTGGRYFWYGMGLQNSSPTGSTEVRLLSNKTFLNEYNRGIIDITIPAGTQEVYFYLPAGKTVAVAYVESSLADVTGSFNNYAITVNDAGGSGQSYERWVSFIGLGGYPTTATYRVTITG